MKYIKDIFILTILIITTACSKDNHNDLSFSSIMLGKEFPDSLINEGFKYYDNDIPGYEGTVLFDLPSSKNSKLNVSARVDYDSKKVYRINIFELNLSQVSELYDMLRAKYGDPITYYSDRTSFLSILLDTHSNAKYNKNQDHIVLAAWHPAGFNSKIEVKELFFYPEKKDNFLFCISYENQEISKIAFEKYKQIIESKETQRKLKETEEYKKEHPFMNQDF